MPKKNLIQHPWSPGMTRKLERRCRETAHLPDSDPKKYSVAIAFLRKRSMRRVQAGQATITQHMDGYSSLSSDSDSDFEPKRAKKTPERHPLKSAAPPPSSKNPSNPNHLVSPPTNRNIGATATDGGLMNAPTAACVPVKLEYAQREGARVQPGDLVMATAGDIKHPAVGYQSIHPCYIIIGVVESFTYIKWCAPKGSSDWSGRDNDHERLVVQWMTVDATLTGQRYVGTYHPYPQSFSVTPN